MRVIETMKKCVDLYIVFKNDSFLVIYRSRSECVVIELCSKVGIENQLRHFHSASEKNDWVIAFPFVSPQFYFIHLLSYHIPTSITYRNRLLLDMKFINCASSEWLYSLLEMILRESPNQYLHINNECFIALNGTGKMACWK